MWYRTAGGDALVQGPPLWFAGVDEWWLPNCDVSPLPVIGPDMFGNPSRSYLHTALDNFFFTTVNDPTSPPVTGFSLALQWLRNDEPIPGATVWNYRIVIGDEGSRISLRMTVTIPGQEDTIFETCAVPTAERPPGGWQGLPPAFSPDCPDTARFTDVPVGSRFHCYIEWLARVEITTGFDDNTFRGDTPVQRQALAAFLYRGLPGTETFATPNRPTFIDKPTSGDFFREVEWLNHSGITRGWPDNTFRPGNLIERQAMAAFLFRASGSPDFTPPTDATFTDVPVGHGFFQEIEWLYSTQITQGWLMPDGTREFRPTNNIERQAIAAFLFRAFRNHHLDASLVIELLG